jgi:hypothetical protein
MDTRSNQSHDIKIENLSFASVLQINWFGKDSNNIKLDSGGNQEEIEFW